MSERTTDTFELEPERYELFGPSLHRFALPRRDFLTALGGGIVVLFVLDPLASPLTAQESGGGRRGTPALPKEIGAWIHIGEDGTITVFTGKVEVGQNARTSLTQAAAEELHAPIESIRLVMGDTDLTPYDMGTFGSMTTPVMAPQIRKAAASAREMLIDLASEAWQVERGTVSVSEGRVTSGARSASFGELTRGKKLMKVISDTAATTGTAQRTVTGRSIPKVDGRAFVTGKHRYPSDVQMPGMLHGKVLRPGSLGASLVTLDSKEAEALPGVTVVRDGDFVGVAAPDPHAASRAVASLRAEWKSDPQPSQREIFDYLKSHPAEGRGSRHETGSIEEGLESAHKKIRQIYTVAYIAHAPLEPRAAVAQWEGDKLTVWTGTQRPFGVKSELAEAFRIPEEKVRVLVPDTGSGYGGKHTADAAIEAARLARAAGKPVKVVWTREEEFTWAYFRPAGVIEVTSGVGMDGKLVAWEFHNYNSGASAIRTLYDAPHQRIEFHPAASPLRQGSYRGLAATANHFARETHMDEIAVALGIDPLEFRLRNTKDERLRAVLEAAASKFSWGKTRGGIAGGFEKGSYVASAAEVAVDRDGTVKVLRVVTAFECGTIVNAQHLENQVEGSVVMGLGGALFEAVQFENGRILNPRFSSYRVPRFSDVPKLETVLLDRKDLPSAGAGETPIVAVAPAVGNAIFAATGIRSRSLPMAARPVVVSESG